MMDRRTILGLAAMAGAFAASGAALGQGKPKGKDKPKKKKNQRNASALLGKDTLKKNGKHKLPKDGKLEPTAEVSGGKVVAMTAAHADKGSVTPRKIKSRKKLAQLAPGVILTGGLQLAQSDVWYYAWWFEDDADDWYYWYDADYVEVDSSWEEYNDFY